ncbi:MAG: response regulator, partial [Verrucomicrobiota bacterium]
MSRADSPASYRIALVEDNPDDRLLFHKGVKRADLPWRIFEYHDGMAEGLEPISWDSPLPDLAFVDLKLPKFSGVELIK